MGHRQGNPRRVDGLRRFRTLKGAPAWVSAQAANGLLGYVVPKP